MYKTNEAVEVKLYIIDSIGDFVTGCTVTSTLYDEADAQHSTPAVSEIGSTGLYTCAITPDAAGEWTLIFHCTTPKVERAITIHVGKGVETSIETKVDTVITNVATVDGIVDNILADTNELQSDWANGGRLDNLLDAIPTTAMRGTDSAATETKQDAQDVLLARIELCATMWGGIEDEVVLMNAADPAAPDAATKFTPDIPAGVTITRAFLLMKFREITCAAAANYVSTAGVVQVKKAGGAFLSGITIPTGTLDVASGAVAPGDVWIGSADVKAQVADGTECEFKLLTLRSNADDLLIRDIQFGLQMFYTL